MIGFTTKDTKCTKMVFDDLSNRAGEDKGLTVNIPPPWPTPKKQRKFIMNFEYWTYPIFFVYFPNGDSEGVEENDV